MKIPHIDMPISAGRAAQILGISVQKFMVLVGSGVIPDCAPKRYHLPTITRAFIAHTEATAPDASREKVRRKIEIEKLNLTRANADMAEKKSEILNRQYAPRAEIENALAPVLNDAERFLRGNFDARFANRCEGQNAPAIKAECQSRIDDAINRIRNGASPELEAAEKGAGQ